MKQIKPTLLLLAAVLLFSSAFAQTPSFTPKGSFSLDLGVPARPKNQRFVKRWC